MIVQLLHQQREIDADVRWLFLTLISIYEAKSFSFLDTEVKQAIFPACSTKTLLVSNIQSLSSFRLFSEFFSPLHVQVIARVNLLCLVFALLIPAFHSYSSILGRTFSALLSECG